MASSIAFLSARGTFYRVELGDKTEAGIYAIEEFMRGDALTGSVNTEGQSADQLSALATAATAPVLFTGISENKSDSVAQNPCLNNVKTFYSFGQNFGSVLINGEVLLGSLGDMNLEGINLIERFFKDNRVSVRLKPITVSVGKSSFLVYLTGMRIGQVDPEYHILPFSYEGVLLDLQNENGDLVNPDSTVLTGDLLSSDSALERALSVRNPEPAPITETASTSSATTGKAVGKKLFEDSPAGAVTNPAAGFKLKTIVGSPLTSDEASLRDLTAKTQTVNSGSVVNSIPAITATGTAPLQPTDDKKIQDLKTRISNTNQGLGSPTVNVNSPPPSVSGNPAPATIPPLNVPAGDVKLRTIPPGDLESPKPPTPSAKLNVNFFGV